MHLENNVILLIEKFQKYLNFYILNLTVVCNVTDHLEKLQATSCSSNSLLLDFTRKVLATLLLTNNNNVFYIRLFQVAENKTGLNDYLICNLTLVPNRTCMSDQSSTDLMNANTVFQFLLK